MRDGSSQYVIRCPYCFGTFPQEHTIFRASKGFSKDELDMDGGGFGGLLGGNDQSEDDSRRLFRKFDSEDSFGSDKKLDTKLIEFWEERGGLSGYINVNKNWDYPHIDPQSMEFMDMISLQPQGRFVPDPDGFVRDEDGFITRVLDKYSGTLTSMDRLCPHCHNPLPLSDYGKYPVKFISVVGITGSGKTVYLNQLLTRFSDVVNGLGFRVGPHNLNSIGESVYPGSPLPASTDDKMMRHPLAVDLLSTDPHSRTRGMTLVFYDIAGENCVNRNGDPDLKRAQNTIGSFISSCDGLIFLLDPEQIPAFAGSNVRANNIDNVVNVMNDIRTNMNPDQPDWDRIPVAVCIAKSDKLRNGHIIPQDNPIFSYPRKNGFDDQEVKQIDGFLHDFLTNNANSVISPLNAFQRRAYFAVSAITCGVESRFEKYQNQYILDEENERKFHHLRRWVENWNDRTPENRAYFHKCPVRQADGSAIEFPYDQDITEWNARDIVADIKADSEFGDSIHLSLWDVAADVDLIGYPVADPAPRRIGDPLKWILWKLRLVGPYYPYADPGKKPILWSAKKWDKYCDDFYADQRRKELEYYGDTPNTV